MRQNESQRSNFFVDRWFLILAIAISLGNGVFWLYNLSSFKFSAKSSAPASAQKAPPIIAVTGLGRLEPRGEVIRLSASTSVEAARVTKLLVEERDKVRAGQVIAILDGYETRLAALNQAKQRLKAAQARLARVKAGTEVGEIAAQQAIITRLEAELRGSVAAFQASTARLKAQFGNAQSEYHRHRNLFQTGVISASALDSKRLTVETLQQQLKETKANLNRTTASLREQISQAKAILSALAEVRPVDVRVAQAEVDTASAAIEKAEADLNLALVRSPYNSQILKIHTRPGELVDSNGIADLGQTDQMYAVAEIYETDIGKVRIGQKATMTGAAFSGQIQGTVTQIGLQVSKQDNLSTNPMADTDRKVIEVKIRIDDLADNQRVAALTNLQVQVAIRV